MSAVVTNWLVFCAPRALPLQNGPAISAIAVNARPLSLTVTTEATTITGMLHTDPSASVNPSSAIEAAATTAMVRIGRNLDPTRSDQRPAAIRPSAPRIWETITNTPAEAADQPRSVISQTRANVHTMACGTTSSTDTAWIRHSSGEPR